MKFFSAFKFAEIYGSKKKQGLIKSEQDYY